MMIIELIHISQVKLVIIQDEIFNMTIENMIPTWVL